MNRFLVSIAAATLIAAPALAAEPQRTATIRYGDLDLSSPAGKRIFERRVARATEKACGSYAAASDAEIQVIDACRAGIKAQIASRRAALAAAR